MRPTPTAPTGALPAVIGGVLGAALGFDNVGVLGALLGVVAGFAIARLLWLGQRLQELQNEVDRLHAQVESARAQPPAPMPVVVPPARQELGPAPVLAPVSGTAAQPLPPRPAARAPVADAETTTRVVEPEMATASRSGWQGLDSLAPVTMIRRFFTDGNTLVRAGVLVLLFGIGFLLRYAAEHSHLPVEYRLTGVAVGALALLGFGWRLRTRRPGYALSLQGGGVGVLYLTVFAALRLYAVLPPGAAFPMLVLVAALSAALAVLQNSMPFAVLGVTGGFLAPILAASGDGNHVVLFGYYAVLNLGILGMTWFRSWRPLNIAGFTFTFLIGSVWGALRYQPQNFLSTEPFLILFFAIYLAIAIRSTLRHSPPTRPYLDAGLLFATPLATFALQAAMLRSDLLALAFSAVALSALYLSLVMLLRRMPSGPARFLAESFLALGLVFLTLAAPLALSGATSASTWALEGAALIWVGCRHGHSRAKLFGACLELLAGLMVIAHVDLAAIGHTTAVAAYVSGLVVGLASILGALLLHRTQDRAIRWEPDLAVAVFLWGACAWGLSGLALINRLLAPEYTLAATLSFFSLSAVTSIFLYGRSAFPPARVAALLLVPAMVVGALVGLSVATHPAADAGFVAWPLAFVATYVILSRSESANAKSSPVLHAAAAWLLAALASTELEWQVRQLIGGTGSWAGISWAVVPAVLLASLPNCIAGGRWPFGPHRDLYLSTVGGGLAVFLAFWSLGANLMLRGSADPLPYVPVLNPLDLALSAVLLVLTRHFGIMRRAGKVRSANFEQTLTWALACLAFVSLNGALFRALSHIMSIPYSIHAMVSSNVVETSLSIFWAVLALLTMLVATRWAHRPTWMAGAGLLFIVVAKLFVVDAASIGTIERIISFVGVGLLMLVLGYFLPLPPAADERRP